MRTVALGALLFVLLLILPATVSAEPLGTSDLLIFGVGPRSRTVNLEQTASYFWLVYNNGTTAYFVNATVSTDDPELDSETTADLVLEGGASAELRLNVTPRADGFTRDSAVRVTVTALNLTSGASTSFADTVEVRVTGLTAATDPKGKILGIFPNPLPAPFNNRWVSFLITVGFWILVGLLILFVITPVLHSLAKGTETPYDDIVLHIVRGPVFALVVLGGAVTSLAILAPPRDWVALLDTVYNLGLILIVTWIVYRVFKDILMVYGKSLSKRAGSKATSRLIPALEKFVGAAIILLGVVTAINALGYDVTIFLAGFGVIGLILAFAAQDSLSNFFASIHLMLDQPFKIGDVIEVEPGVICRVRDIGLRSTKLYWIKNHELIIMPNRLLANNKIINYVEPDPRFKVRVHVGVAYSSDLDKVKRILVDVAKNHPNVLRGPEYDPVWRVTAFGDSAIEVLVVVWVDDAMNQWNVASDIRHAIKKRFDEEGIVIPFPQRDVWMKGSGETSKP